FILNIYILLSLIACSFFTHQNPIFLFLGNCFPSPLPANHPLISSLSPFSYTYAGPDPAEGLREFIKGPAIIDCGMYCQLSLYYAIMTTIGDEKFNSIFSKKPLTLGAILFDPDHNDLFPFLSSTPQSDEPLLFGVGYVAGDPNYEIEHPGGAYGGNNYVFVKDEEGSQQSILLFDPNSSPQTANSIEEVRRALFAHMSDPPSELDIDPDILRHAPTERLLKVDRLSYFGWGAFIQYIAVSTTFPNCGQTEQPSEKSESNKAKWTLENFPVLPGQEIMFESAKRFTSERPACCYFYGPPGTGKTTVARLTLEQLVNSGVDPETILWIDHNDVSIVDMSITCNPETGLPEFDPSALREKITGAISWLFVDDANIEGARLEALMKCVFDWYYGQDRDEPRSLLITANTPLAFTEKQVYRSVSLLHPAVTGMSIVRIDIPSLRRNALIDSLGELLSHKLSGESVGYVLSDESELKEIEAIPDEQKIMIPSFPKDWDHRSISMLNPSQREYLEPMPSGYYSLKTYAGSEKEIVILEISSNEQSFRNLKNVLTEAFKKEKKVVLILKHGLTMNAVEEGLKKTLRERIKEMEKVMDRFRSLFAAHSTLNK
ncbi:MAG: ATP-binding protein, partial [Pseudomonadota bacterium]